MKAKQIISLILIAFFITNCSSLTKTQKGAAVGTATGAATGAIIGKTAGNTALGAIIGATVGGVAGVLIGKEMDKQAEDMKTNIPNAKVERIEEGILLELNGKVLFKFDDYQLTPTSKSSLDNLVTILKKYPDTNIEVQGHTDDIGTDSYNNTLSLNRAASVVAYLKDKGIIPLRLTQKGYGKLYPRYSNSNEDGRALNRRVDFLVYASDNMIKQINNK